MTSFIKGVIVLALVVAIATVLIFKRSKSSASSSPISAEIPAVVQIEYNEPAKKLPKLVDLGAGKCIPCKMMKPILDELKTSYAGRLDVVFIDVWENAEVAKQYGISSIPTQIFYDESGKELFRHEGFYAKEDILGKYKELGINLAKELADGK